MDCLLTKMSEIIELHSSACLKEIPRKDNKLNKAKKGQCEIIPELNLEFEFEEWICFPLIENKAKSKGTHTAGPDNFFFCKFYTQI